MAKHMVSVGDLVLDVILPVTLPVQAGQHQEPSFRRLEPGGAGNLMTAAAHLESGCRRQVRSARTRSAVISSIC